MTVSDRFYNKIGRMTVEFGQLDFLVASLARHMASRWREEEEASPYTARKLDAVEEWAKKHRGSLGAEVSDEIIGMARDAKALLRRRQDAVHGLWVQEGDESPAWALKLPSEEPVARPSGTEESTVEELTAEAAEMFVRVSRAMTLRGVLL